MNKIESWLKYLYILIFITGVIWFGIKVFTVSQRETHTIASIISAIVILLLVYFFIVFLIKLLTATLRIFTQKELNQKAKYKSEIKYSLLGLILVFIIWFGINLMSAFYVMEIPAFTSKHYRTNIFTRTCNYGGESGNIESNPWYYKPDCKLEQKINIAKKEGFYISRNTECLNYCETVQKDYFCNTHYVTVGNAWGAGPENLLCDEILNCSKINCEEHRRFRETNKTAPLQ